MSRVPKFSATAARAVSRGLRGFEVARGASAARFQAVASFGTVHVSLSARLGPGLRLRATNDGTIHLAEVFAERGLALISDGGQIEIASGCFFNSSCTISSRKSIKIGPDTIFGENVKIYDHDHAYGTGSMHNDYVHGAVSVGSRCWFGSNVVVLRGVTICDDVVIGANSVVTKSISQPGVYVAAGGLRRVR